MLRVEQKQVDEEQRRWRLGTEVKGLIGVKEEKRGEIRKRGQVGPSFGFRCR